MPNDFSKLLLVAVEEGLSSLGDSPKRAVYFCLENSFKLKKERIPANLTEFTFALERIFGSSAPHIEKLIARRLHEQLGLDFHDDVQVDFLDCLQSLRKLAPR